jgi:hypothetical protein
MDDIKADGLVEFFCLQPGGNLPDIVINSLPDLYLIEKFSDIKGEMNKKHVNVLKLSPGQRLFHSLFVIGMSDDPNLMEPVQLLDELPSDNVLSGMKLERPAGWRDPLGLNA